MKNKISALLLAACMALSFNACIEENPSVVLNGIVGLNSASCASTDASGPFLSEMIYSNSKFSGYLNVSNNMTTSSPWSSSGGSSSGATLDVENPNLNAIYVDQIYVRCVSIDDDADACAGRSVYKKNLSNMMVPAGSNSNIPFLLSLDDLDWGINQKAELKITAHYHDSGVLSGRNYETSSTIVSMEFVDAKTWSESTSGCENADKPEKPTDCAVWGQENPSLWKCDNSE